MIALYDSLFTEYKLRTPEMCSNCGNYIAEWGSLCGFCLDDIEHEKKEPSDSVSELD
jgi:predicted amidophosphoribosyltransferase